jgi:peptidoglycan/LPS O-acetylase OafA/YrhL
MLSASRAASAVLPIAEETPLARRRALDIDPFRGLVCLSLMVLHFYQNGPLRTELERLLGHAGIFAILHVRLGVESFFVLAGFMMAHMLRPVPGEQVSMLRYLERRFYRLIVPYWIAVLLAAADRWAMGLVMQTSRAGPEPWEILTQLSLTREFFDVEDAAPGYWSMVSLEQFYLCFLGIYALCLKVFGQAAASYGKAERVLSWVSCAACLGSAALVSLHIPTRVELPQYALYLTLGLLLYWALRTGFARVELALGLGALGVVIASTLGELSRPLAAVVGVTALAYLGRGHRLPSGPLTRVLGYCGSRSYSIYLVHAVVGIRVLTLARFLDLHAVWTVPLLFGLACALSLLAAEVFFRSVEQPWQARARRVSYRTRGRPA